MSTSLNHHDDFPHTVRDAFPVADDDMQQLRTRLETAADAAGVLDVAYRTVDSPVGPLLIAATGVGLVRLAFANEDHDVVLQELSDRISPRVLAARARLEPTARELDEYFAGRRREFDIPLDWSLSSGFRNTVLRHLPGISYGHTATYTDVAQLAGKPTAMRAVGTACATNPIPVVVPCHRVVRADGTMGGYRGGVDAKRILLAMEAA
jgi:methylated-DNA-[protein]-cysteine S-methyltransferase